MTEIYYLGEDCPKCGSYRVLPVLPVQKDDGVRGHCLKCGHDFASERTSPEGEELMNEEKKKEIEEHNREYDKHLQNVIEKLDKTEDAIGDMITFCSHGEPEFYGSKALKFFFQNLSDLNRNGKHFLYEMMDEIKYRKESKV